MPSAPDPPRPAGGRRRWIQSAGLLLGLFGLVIAVVSTADDLDGSTLPAAGAFVAAGVLAIVSLTSAGRAWSTLLETRVDGRDVRGALYLSQLSKYLPAGGLIQAAGQVSMTVRGSVSAARAAVAFPVAALEVVVAGAVVGSGLALHAEVPAPGRWFAACAPLSLVALHPSVLRWLLQLAGRLSSRVPAPDHVPPTGAIVRSTMFALVNMVATSVAYVVLLDGLAPEVDRLATLHAFSAAWVIGFLVIPIPSGLGIRESVLAALVPGVGVGALLAASLAHRVVTIVAEVVVTSSNVASRRWHRGRRQKSPA